MTERPERGSLSLRGGVVHFDKARPIDAEAPLHLFWSVPVRSARIARGDQSRARSELWQNDRECETSNDGNRNRR